MKLLITGAAGFIGFHLANHLLSTGNHEIVLIDNLNEYYDVTLKADRLKELERSYPDKYSFIKLDLGDRKRSISSLAIISLRA